MPLDHLYTSPQGPSHIQHPTAAPEMSGWAVTSQNSIPRSISVDSGAWSLRNLTPLPQNFSLILQPKPQFNTQLMEVCPPHWDLSQLCSCRWRLKSCAEGPRCLSNFQSPVLNSFVCRHYLDSTSPRQATTECITRWACLSFPSSFPPPTLFFFLLGLRAQRLLDIFFIFPNINCSFIPSSKQWVIRVVSGPEIPTEIN